jgi:sugar O-acyltransferase (sialic acid O-acetyltransferase NeuD family)
MAVAKRRDSNTAVAVIGFFDGSAGQVETWFEEVTGLTIACFIIDDDNFVEVDVEEENRKRECKTTEFPQDGQFKGRPVIATTNWVEIIASMGIDKVISLDPNNESRRRQIESARINGMQLVSAIHPSAIILPEAKLDDGIWVNARATVGYKAEIGAGALINTGVQIDHHTIVEECCQLDPGVVTAGNTVLKTCCHLHTGSILINRISIGANSIIGAGTVVIKDVPPDCTVVGVPGRIIKKHNVTRN